MWTKLSGGKDELLKGKSEVGLARPVAHGERNNQGLPWPIWLASGICIFNKIPGMFPSPNN